MRRHLGVIGALLVLGCQDIRLDAPTPTEVIVSADPVHLSPEETTTLTFIVRDDAGRLIYAPTAEWTSLDLGVVTSDSTGMLRGIAEGIGRIVVRAVGVADTVLVLVRRDWLATGGYYSRCRVRGDGALLCNGALNTGTPASTIGVTASNTGQCVIAAGGVVWCRGSDYAGALGDGLPVDTSSTNVTRDAFAPVSGPGGYTAIFTNYPWQFCGLQGTEIRCWGYDTYGQVGDDTVVRSMPSPTVVAGGLSFTSLAMESPVPQTCGTAGGRLWCWGSFATFPAPAYARVPRPVSPDVGLVSASVGVYHTCGLDNAGEAICWGFNNDGELGRGTVGPNWVYDSAPAPVNTSIRFTNIFVTFYLTCGVSTLGELWCWGRGSEGQLGVPVLTRSAVPVRIPSPQRFTSIYRGSTRGACALTVGGAEYCWGGLTVNLDTKPEDYLPRRTPSPF